jgi:autotransporter-associated beta strand protein
MRITSGNTTIGPVTLNGGILDGASGANSGAQYGAFAFTGNITVGAAATSTIESDISAPDCLTAGTLAPFIIFNVTNASGILNVTTALANSSGTQAAAGLVKAGPGTMNLSAVNLYSGTTTISNGTLLVTSGGSISNGPVVITGGTLGGAGTINGAITDQAGGNLAPGAQVSSPGTTLTCNSNVTLQLGSTTTMQVEHGYSPDQLTVAGTLTYGGILMVATNAADSQAYQVGDTFTLFNLNGGTYNSASSFATIQPPPGPGLGWSGASLTANGQIQVVTASPVVAGFTRTPSSGVFPLAVTFNNTSSGATYWVWNFGDGTTLLTTSAASPRHTYTTAGNFTVIQTAYGPGGVSSVTNTASVIVAYPPPVAMFLTTPTNGFLPLLVTNTDASTGVITNWLWNLGDGTTVTNSSNTNVVHSYAAAGTYTVSLTVTGPGGVSTNTITNDVVVTYAPPVAAFTGTPLNPYVAQSVTFTSTSTGTITNWLWNLGDGTTVTNTSNANVVHAYAAPGTYTVSLMVAGPGGANTNTRTAYVVVTYAPPVAAFSGTPTSLFLSQSVTFTSTSTGVITNWLWNLGDGTTVTNTSNANVVHAYALPGTYTVSLTVGGPGGANTNTQTAYIVVKAKISVRVATLVNGNLVISGVNGPVGGQYRILNTTDLTLPLANWTPVWTNTFAPPNGSFSYTNAPGTNAAGFFLMVSP